MAFTAQTRDGRIGFITTGHSTANGKAMFSGWNTGGAYKQMGTCTSSYNSTYYDLAFVQRGNTSTTYWAPKNVLNWAAATVHGLDFDENYIIEGYLCYCEARGGTKQGVITNTRYSFSGKSDRILASYPSSESHSGGAVYVVTSRWGSIYRTVIGIHNGSAYDITTGQRIGAFSTKVDYVYSILNAPYLYSE